MVHHHSHPLPGDNSVRLNKAFQVGIILNMAFVIIEFSTGFYNNSLSLLSDAGHNLSDVATLSLSLFAFRLARKKATRTFTYGYDKGTILASLVNAVILLIAVGSIGWEAIQRFLNPEPTEGTTISIVAGIGICVNAVSALFFFRHKDSDLNVKGAYLHLLTDALVSLGVVIAGILITYTGILWIDPLVSLVIMLVVIAGTWGLLKESLRLSLDAVPSQLDVEEIKQVIMKQQGVVKVFHIHLWAMSTTKNAITAHLVVNAALSPEELMVMKKNLRHDLEHMGVHHATFETDAEKKGISPDE